MTAWVMNAIGLLANTIGVLLLFLYLHKTSPAAETAGGAPVFANKERKLLKFALGLMAAWFIVQYIALIWP